MSSVQSWTGDAIDVALAADFDGSLSCLGIELGTENYDMSAPLNSLMQSVSSTDYTHENGDTSPSRDSPFSLRHSYCVQAKKTRLALNADEDVSSAIKRFCISSEDKENNDSSSQGSSSSRCRHSSSVPDLRMTGSPCVGAATVSVLSPSMLSQMLQISDSPPPPYAIRDVPATSLKNTGFQYVLGAATSIATKINEETMTYLNQGQSYEIKLKKLGDLTEMRGKMLKSIIRVGFQERRLQYSEKEQIAQWQSQRIGERILEIDIPLSYGVYEVSNDPSNIHICEFLWDPTNETGVFVRLNCISTEFTPKKHGGEKGAPFRIQIETFSHDSIDPPQRLHVASCQVKVFKPKGADRKHKTDREKMSKRSQVEQDKYKTSYDCTVFSECSPDSLYITTTTTISSTGASTGMSPVVSSCFSPPKVKLESSKSVQTPQARHSKSKSDSVDLSDVSSHSPDKFPSTDSIEVSSEVSIKEEPKVLLHSAKIIGRQKQDDISAEFTIKETLNWLKKNNFNDLLDMFANYNGTDMLRLSPEDCIKICGLTDGVRLFNSLHCKPVLAKKVLFVRLSIEDVFRAVYLHELCASYMIAKLSILFHIPVESIHDLRMRTPIAHSVASYTVTDEVVTNIQTDSLFIMDLIMHGTAIVFIGLACPLYNDLNEVFIGVLNDFNDSTDKCILLLKPYKEED